MARRVHTLTPWEAGQILIDCADLLFDKEDELREVDPLLANEVKRARLIIGFAFNKHGSHEFLLPDVGDHE